MKKGRGTLTQSLSKQDLLLYSHLSEITVNLHYRYLGVNGEIVTISSDNHAKHTWIKVFRNVNAGGLLTY